MRELKNQLRYVLPLWFVLFITGLLPDNRISIRLRGFFASFFVKKCGRNFTIASGVVINNPQGLEIGDHVYIAKGCWLNAMAGLKIEDEVIFAPYVVISTTQHVFNNNSVRFGGSIAKPVLIGKGSWLASHVSVKCGVKIGKGNLIAANASVTKNTPDNKIVGGVPAKIIRDNIDTKASFSSRAEFEKSRK